MNDGSFFITLESAMHRTLQCRFASGIDCRVSNQAARSGKQQWDLPGSCRPELEEGAERASVLGGQCRVGDVERGDEVAPPQQFAAERRSARPDGTPDGILS